MTKRILAGAVGLALAVTLVAVGQTPPVAPSPAKPEQTTKTSDPTDKVHSKLVLRETPYSFLDDTFKAQVTVFESVAASANQADKMLYLSPLCVLVPFDGKGETKYHALKLGNGYTEITFQAVNYYDGMFADAAERLNLRHGTAFKAKQFALMPVSMMSYTLELPGTTTRYTDTTGNLDEYLSWGKTSAVKFAVKDADVDLIDKLVKSPGGLRLSAKLYYNALGLRRRIESWTVEDVRDTKLGKHIDAGGAGYFTAQEVEEMLTEIAIKRGMYDYEDPGMGEAIKSKAREIFDKLTANAAEVVIKNQADAQAEDVKLRKATGLTVAEFKPVELRYQYKSEVLDSKTYLEANQKAEEFYKREQTSFSASAKGGWGPVSGRACYSRSTDNWAHKRYGSQTEFEEEKKNWRAENGDGVRFEPRGLNLVEKGHLKNNLNATVTSVTVRPVSLAGKLTITTNTAGGTEFAAGLGAFLKLKDDMAKVKTAVEAHDTWIGLTDPKVKRLEDVSEWVGFNRGVNGRKVPYFRTNDGSIILFESDRIELQDNKGEVIGVLPFKK